ncbi:MAG: HdeD family acid-resistance protein [Oscillospiraceae bacterium]
MKNLFRRAKTGGIILSVLVILLGLLLLIFPTGSIEFATTVIGIGLLVWGIGKLIGFFVSRDVIAVRFDLAGGLMMTLIGAVILFNPAGIAGLVLSVTGITVLIDSIFKIQSALSARRVGLPHWQAVLIPAVIACIGGVLIVFNPFGAARLLVRVIGISVIVSGITNLTSALCMTEVPPSEIDIEAEVRDAFSDRLDRK